MEYINNGCSGCAATHDSPSECPCDRRVEYLEKLGFVIVDGHAVGFVDENDQPVRQKVEVL